jgi:hypothetical protein
MMKLAGRVIAVIVLLSGTAAVSVWAQQRAGVERVRQRLIGSYKLMSYVSFDQNGVATKLPYSVGQISYDAAGRMSAQLMRDDRPRFTPGSPASEAERAAAYSSYISYFGRYEIDAEKSIVTHHVEGSIGPNMVGSAMPRHYEFSADGRSLFLSVKNGDRVTGKLQWDRYK